MIKDPICKQRVKQNDAFALIQGGKIYYFCSPHCLAQFKKEYDLRKFMNIKREKESPNPVLRNKRIIVSA